MLENRFGSGYNRVQPLNGFKENILKPLYIYLFEALQERNVVLSLLKRYKHKCEWFQSEQLYNFWDIRRDQGEGILAMHLYEYLYDQGVEFSIEPKSDVGRADLVSSQNSSDPLIADAKVFTGSKAKTHIIQGFNQIYIYTNTYNEAVGYLIIYNVSGEDLNFSVKNQQQTTPYIVHNSKTIFLIVIDIYQYEKTASERGRLKTNQITEQELIQYIEDSSSKP